MSKIDYTYAPNPINEKNGTVMLMSALKLYAEITDNDGNTKQVPIGMANSMDVNERRNIIYNFVIGNTDPSTARDLIAGPVEESTISVGTIVMYKANLIGLLSNGAGNNTNDGSLYAASIRYQTRPFKLVEQWVNPAVDPKNGGQVVLTQTYNGCMISDVRKTRSMQNTDWRVLEDVTIHFKNTDLVVNEQAINNWALGNLDLSL